MSGRYLEKASVAERGLCSGFVAIIKIEHIT